MQHATQVALTRRVIDFVDRSTTELAPALFLNPVATYTCPRQAAREAERFFSSAPLFFGLSCELSNPGDFRADDLSGVPVLVVRGKDGALNAFLNVCRHRGAKVASGRGSGKRLFVCPYHAWTYDLDGRLTRIAPAEGFPGVTCEERSLVPHPRRREARPHLRASLARRLPSTSIHSSATTSLRSSPPTASTPTATTRPRRSPRT